jgi:hypothetical protein
MRGLFTPMRQYKIVYCYQFNHAISAAAAGTFADTVTLNGVTNYAFLANCFSQFKIDWAEMRIFPTFNVTQPTDQEGSVFATVVSPSNDTNPSLATICASSDALCTPLTEEHYHRWRPMWSINGIISRGWLNTNQQAVEWYGVKSYIGISTNENAIMNYFVRFQVSYRGNMA